MPVLNAYANELPRLEAMDSLRHVTEIALGTGSVERDEQRRALRTLQTQADGGRRPRPTPAEVALIAGSMGLTVEKGGA